VQKLFSNNRGTHVLPIKSGAENVSGQNELYATAAWDDKTREIIFKIVNSSAEARKVDIQLKGARKLLRVANLVTLSSPQGSDVNSFEKPEQIKPVESSMEVKGNSIQLPLAAKSLTIVKIKSR
jgi:alpha-N-arabinofuranosidase